MIKIFKKLTRLIKFWPRLVEYETTVYQKYLKRYFCNETREWKIGEMWSYKVRNNYVLVCGFYTFFRLDRTTNVIRWIKLCKT